ncbi:MAG TPA: diguanylate cyclase [Gemmatimonadaceae bacterium]|nr:diguanylate cyclase [Gemmatimonadaceae bacterium]
MTAGEVAEARSIDALVEEGQQAERQGRREDARKLYERALYRLRQPEQASLAAALLRWIGRTHQVDGNLEATLDCSDAALAIAEACEDEAAIGHAINLQAIVRWQQGRLDDAEALYLRARSSALRSGEARLVAMTSQGLGVLSNIRGDLEGAMHHYEASLAGYRSLGLARDVAGALNNLGMLYTDMQRWEEAERAYGEAVQIADVLGDLTALVLYQVNLAEMWVARGEFDRARQCCDRAMQLSAQTGDTHAHGEAYKIYGIIARDTGDYVLAEQHFIRARAIAEERQDLLLQAETAKEQADLYSRQGRNRDTLQNLNRAHRAFSQLRARRDLADVDRRMGRLEGEFIDVVRRWGESIESKDRYTQGHCERVADVACALAARTGMDPQSLFWFRIGAVLHDVGKLIIPPEVLNKPGKLTADEWELIKRHPAAGVEMLADIEFPWDVRPIVESHHERWDGRGYPHGLAGEAIPLTARILCVADVYDALTSVRSYKRALGHAEAMEIMRADVGMQFDPALFALFEEIMAEGPPGPSSAVQSAIQQQRAAAAQGAAAPEASAAPPDLAPFPIPPNAQDEAAAVGAALDVTIEAAAGAGAPSAGLVGVASEVAWRAKALEIDDLTGVAIRRAFVDLATRTLADRGADGPPVSLLVIDVDRFKQVNDTFGHLQGDDVLRLVAQALREGVGADGVVGRYAGDEFVALLPGAAPAQAREVAERLRLAVEASCCPARDGGPDIRVSLSIGVAGAPEHSSDFDGLFAAADRALYQAKRRGRNAVAVAGKQVEVPEPKLHLERFVGRIPELRRLVKLLDESAGGAPRVVAISGEAGVGKSTLLRELWPEARARGATLVLGRALEADVKPPYGPWADVIEAIRRAGIAPDRPWHELPRLAPALKAAAPVPTLAAEDRPAGSKYALLDEISEYIRLAAVERPLILVLDDMQWGDSASWDTLEHLVAQLERDRVLVCLTIRAEDARGDVQQRRQRLSRDERFHELQLARLTEDELSQWVEATFQHQEVDGGFRSFLYRHTEGNPLFAAQLLRTLVDEGVVYHTGERWEWRPVPEQRLPVAVSDLLTRRLERLSDDARGVLMTAAVIGRTFDIDLALAAGAGTEAELLDAIDAGVSAAVLERTGDTGADQYAFTHTLLVEVIRRSANARRLRRAHERVAKALEERRPSAVAEIAAHYDAGGNAPKAYDYALRAGAQAAAVHAHDEASALYAMALGHAPGPREATEIRLRMADVAEAAGRYADAEALCGEVLDALAAAHAPAAEVLPVRRMRARVRGLLGASPRQTLDECMPLLAEAEAAGLQGERVALLTMISRAHGRLANLTAAEALAREGVRMAQEMGDEHLLADALARLASVLYETRPLDAVGPAREALEICTRLGDKVGQVRCHITLGVAYTRAGEDVLAEAAYQVAYDLGRNAHAPDLAGLASVNLGVRYMRAGRYEQARERFESALRLFTTVRNNLHRLVAMYNTAHLMREHGETEAALERLESCAALARDVGQMDIEIGARAGAGLAALALGRCDQAKRALRDVNALIETRADWWFQGKEQVGALGVLTALASGDVGGAVRRFTDALAEAERHEPYSAAWLVAECATPLADAGYAGVWETVERHSRQVGALGYALLSARYATLAELSARSR